jgi:hypothetical protein
VAIVVVVLMLMGKGNDGTATSVGCAAVEVNDAAVTVGHGGIKANLPALGVVDRADLFKEQESYR